MKLSAQLFSLALASLLALAPSSAEAAGKERGSFTVGKGSFLLNGKPFVVKAAELHYPRIPRQYWEHRIEMCKALGMNTVCLYVFWNIHEQREGEFDFSGNNDVAAFCRLAQKHGMYVIVRPGPYVCAEWEMGGLPWWLLKKNDIRLRESDPYFIERVKIFEREVGKQLSGLTIQNGGPIIMVQVENEYGSYGTDKPYVATIRDIVKASGFDQVALFQCDWASNFTNNALDDLTWTMNFGTGANIDAQFKRLGELRPDAPKMCSEFWSGWFDKWGARHETRPARAMVEGIDEMLSKGISFSLYMTHGGTSFGHWAGANSPGFAPDVTSYDYDAPINEYGQPTEKYYQLREILQKYSDTKLPSVPKPVTSIISLPEIKLQKIATLDALIDSTAESSNPLTMEDMNQGWGLMKYSTTLPEIATRSTLTIDEPHDYAQVFINGKLIGKIDRVQGEKSLALPAVSKGDRLEILVEAMGRINFGRAIKDYKGITKGVSLSLTLSQGEGTGYAHEVTYNLKGWKCSRISDNYTDIIKKVSSPHGGELERGLGSGLYSATFNLKRVGDTFLNMERWGKGQVYVNGYAIGRFWSIGPQQTLYLPGCWLKKGKNEIVVLDVVGPREATLWGQQKPELDKLQVEKPNRHDSPADRPDLSSLSPAHAGSLAPGNGWQEVKFGAPATGRYLALEISSTHDGSGAAQIAELYALDTGGKRISREPWTAKYADSEDADHGNKTLDKVFDLQESTSWSATQGSPLPHLIVIDMGASQVISGFDYLPRAEKGAPGSVKDYKVFVY